MELDVGVRRAGSTGRATAATCSGTSAGPAVLTYRLPELTEELIGYRYRRLGAARRLAAEHGYQGALFPWQSGSDGREETPTWIFNPRSGRWFPDHSRLQRHVNLAVAYNVWQHYEVTDDVEFLANYGAELLVEIARFFASLAVFNADRERYEIRGVVGPDEYHDAYPGADRPGIDNNAYTNVMVVWLMHRAIDTLAILRGYHRDELVSALAVDPAEVERWATSQQDVRAVSRRRDQPVRRLRATGRARLGCVPEALREYRSTGSDPGSRRRYAQPLQASKQADTLMLLYLFRPKSCASCSRAWAMPYGRDDPATSTIISRAPRTARPSVAWWTPGSWRALTAAAPGHRSPGVGR